VHPQHFIHDDFSFGLDNTSVRASLDPKSLADCKNFNLTSTRGLEKRGGMTKLYPTAAIASTAIKSLHEYKAPNGTIYNLVQCGTKVLYYAAAVWNDLKTGLTAGKRNSYESHQGFVYSVNGTDANWKSYNTTVSGVGIAPPAAAPTVSENGAGALTGKFKYVYCYKRSTAPALTGNPSPASSEITVSAKKINVSYVASADPQVDKIAIYRSFNFASTAWDGYYYKVVEVANATSSYDDQILDANLTTTCQVDNDVPPKAKFIRLHKDYIFYAYCPDREDGKSLVVWSKRGIGEAVPALNYQYFDRSDGEEITGIASVGDYLLVFKRNKVAVLEGEFQDIYTMAYGIGCIAPWAILQFEDKVVFLAEEGWKSCDGKTIYDLTGNVRGWVRAKYISKDQADNYSAVYYPVKSQFMFLMNVQVPIVAVGHFLVPLLFVDKGIPEQKAENLVGWTYHKYDNHTLTCFGSYTDADGIQRVIAGSSLGYVFQLDSGTTDDGYDISYLALTGWNSLGTPESYLKFLRRVYLLYTTSEEHDIDIFIERDFMPKDVPQVVTGVNAAYCGYCYCGYAYCGIDGSINEIIKQSLKGKLFRIKVEGTSDQELVIQKIVWHFRTETVR